MSGESARTLNIRPAEPRDAMTICSLADQLGYRCTRDEIRERIEQVRGHSGHAILVAETATDGILGWLHTFAEPSLLSEQRAEIAGLIVDERFRGQGIGRALLQRAEAWAARQGCRAVGVRSNTIRADAPAFYTSMGYETIKTQRVFRKRL
jgi:GNAT superfamily N-acetyltransferase